MLKPKVLFTSPMLMHPAASGPHLRIENSIKALTQVSDLHIVSRVAPFAIGGQSAIDFYSHLATEFSFSPSVANLSTWRTFRRVQIVARMAFTNDAKHLVHYAKKHGIDTIWFGYGNISYPLIKQVRALTNDLRLICDTDSVWSRFLFREIPFVEDEAEQRNILAQSLRKEEEEKSWVDLCDITTAVSEVDAKYYRNLTVDKNKIAIFSNVLDLDAYQGSVLPPKQFTRPAIYLAGSFGKATSAMNRAATWLLQDILPLVKKSIPNVHCYIVGNHSDKSFGHIQDPSITIAGRVESVLPYLKNVDVAVTPLQFESGTRFKILEAAACKVPMVSTTLGAEGLPVKHEQELLIADTTASFAAAIVRLIEDPALGQRLAQNSYELVKAHFSIKQLMDEAQHILQGSSS